MTTANLNWRFSPSAVACVVIVMLACNPVPARGAELPSVQAVYQGQVQPLFKKYCYECHGAVKPKGDVRLDTLPGDFLKASDVDREAWHEVLQNLQRGEMPPPGKPRPTPAEHGQLVDWLQRAFREAREQRQRVADTATLGRLTSYEFQNTLEDLLGMKLNFAPDQLLPEVPSRDGFLNNGVTLATSSQHVKSFWTAARLAMAQAIVTGAKPAVQKQRLENFLEFNPPGTAAKNRGNGGQAADPEFGSTLLPDTALMAPLESWTSPGRFRIRINLRATGPNTCLLVWTKLGLKAQPMKFIAKPEVQASAENQTIDIFGNVEDLPGWNPKPVVSGKGAKPKPFPAGGYLCISNVGTIHHLGDSQGAEGFPRAVDSSAVRRFLAEQAEDPKKARYTSVVRVNSIEIEAPFYDDWPPSSQRQILFASPNQNNEPVYAREVIERFMQRAWRRPVSKAEVDVYVSAFEKLRPGAASFEDALRETLASVLLAPQFLTLIEPRDPQPGRAPVSDEEWATRLSYFLWNSMPDEELMRLAQNKGLQDAATRARQVERLLADQRSWRFTETFVDQWLGIGALDKVAVNPEFHPTFDEDLKPDMRRETQLLFHECLHSNLSCLTLIEADFAFLTNRLADHYGIPHGPGTPVALGSGFERVPLPPDSKRNGGLLTQGSILLLNSDGVESHPVKRAVWVRNAILDDPPPDPPADVPELKIDDRAESALTLKQRIEQHRASANCANCHSRLDPWGIPFEQYDALGCFRSKYAPLSDAARKHKSGAQGEPVDAKTVLPDGKPIDGVAELQQYLLTQGKERFARAIVRKTLAYALRRSLTVDDESLVESLTQHFMAHNFQLRSLIQEIVLSEPFLHK